MYSIYYTAKADESGKVIRFGKYKTIKEAFLWAFRAAVWSVASMVLVRDDDNVYLTIDEAGIVLLGTDLFYDDYD